MTGLDRRTRSRVGELAACPLDQTVAAEIRTVISTALRRSKASKKAGGATVKSHRPRKVGRA